MSRAKDIAKETGGSVDMTHDPVEAVKEAILRKATTPELREIAIKEGFRTMADMGREMIVSGDLNFREFDRVLSME